MPHTRKLIILEGPDCAGKTTLMAGLKEGLMTWGTVHSGPLPMLSEADLALHYLDSVFTGLQFVKGGIIMDRCWMSEPIYGKVFRNGLDRIGERAKLIENALRHLNPIVVLCMPPFENVKNQWLARKGADSAAEYLDRFDQLEDVYNLYTSMESSFPIVEYDYTVGKFNFAELL